MPIDASIYGLIKTPKSEGPLDTYGKAMTVKNLMGQGQLQDLQRTQLVDSMDRQQRLRDLFAGGNVTPEQVMAVDPATGMKMQEHGLKTKKLTAETRKTEIEAFGAAAKQLRDMTAGVNDDAGMVMLKEGAMRLFGPDVAAKMNIPDRFDPEWKNRQLLTADSLLKQIEDQKQRDFTAGQNQLNRNVQIRGQDTTAATARRGQDMTDDRERDLDFQANLAAAKEAAKVKAKSSAEAAASLPGDIQKANEGIALIDQMIGTAGKKLKPGEKAVAPHPGFQSFVGATLIPGLRFVEGTDTAGFGALYDQIKGKAFLEAFQSIKGGGHITEIEGEKATQAITRMNKSQTEEEFVKAAREFQDVIRKGIERAQAKAAGQQPAAGGGGIKFLGFEGQ